MTINDTLAELFRTIRKKQELTFEYVFIYQSKRIKDVIPLFIIMFKITQLRNCGISACTVVEKNV